MNGIDSIRAVWRHAETENPSRRRKERSVPARNRQAERPSSGSGETEESQDEADSGRLDIRI